MQTFLEGMVKYIRQTDYQHCGHVGEPQRNFWNFWDFGTFKNYASVHVYVLGAVVNLENSVNDPLPRKTYHYDDDTCSQSLLLKYA